ncbi:MAG: peptidoglycan editing factor PgeF [Trueperaceae bacterium]
MEALDLQAFERGPLATPHGFSPRSGGVSAAPYASLNLGASVGDAAPAVAENRRRVRAAFGVPEARWMTARQVHGAQVLVAGRDPAGAEGDALVADDPAWALAISAADCLPVLLLDARTGAVGAAHAGWRGAVAGVVGATLEVMATRFGTAASDVRAWLGPAIQGACYQVGPEVVDAAIAAGAPEDAVHPDPGVAGRWRFDVPALVRAQLIAAGVPAGAVAVSATCTHCAADRCFSHRRDAGRTGRHWAVLRPLG